MEYSKQSQFRDIGKYLESKVQTIQKIQVPYVHNKFLKDVIAFLCSLNKQLVAQCFKYISISEIFPG